MIDESTSAVEEDEGPIENQPINKRHCGGKLVSAGATMKEQKIFCPSFFVAVTMAASASLQRLAVFALLCISQASAFSSPVVGMYVSDTSS